MYYIDTITNEWGLTQAEIMQRHPMTVFPEPFAPLEQYAVVIDQPQPAYDAATHKLMEIKPKLVSGEWLQQWRRAALTDAEVEQHAVEQAAAEQAAKDASRLIITRTQGLIALFRMGGIEEPAIQGFIDQIENPAQRYEAGLYFRAANWHSDDPFVLSLAPMVGAETEEKLRALFEYAKTL